MFRPLPSPAAGSIVLRPGQTLRLWLPDHATLVCNGPSLTIAGPSQWIAGQWLQQRQVVGEGQSLWLAQGGWLQIDAARGGELLCLPPPASDWLARARRQVTRWIRNDYRGKDLSGVSKTG